MGDLAPPHVLPTPVKLVTTPAGAEQFAAQHTPTTRKASGTAFIAGFLREHQNAVETPTPNDTKATCIQLQLQTRQLHNSNSNAKGQVKTEKTKKLPLRTLP